MSDTGMRPVVILWEMASQADRPSSLHGRHHHGMDSRERPLVGPVFNVQSPGVARRLSDLFFVRLYLGSVHRPSPTFSPPCPPPLPWSARSTPYLMPRRRPDWWCSCPAPSWAPRFATP